MRKRIIYICFMLCFLISFLQAQDFKGILQSANTALQAKSYDEAIVQYKQILDSGKQSLAVYYNLGSAYYEKGDIPNAILYFEKGLKQDPFDKSILHNLSLAKEQLDSDIVEIPEFILKKGWKYIFTRFSANTWYTLGFLTAILMVFSLGVWLLHSDRVYKKKGFIAGGISLLLSVFFFCLSSSQANFQHSLKTAIILKDGIDLKSAPEEANEAIMTLLPGTKLFIIDKIGDYEKVRLENGQLGWVPMGDYQRI